MSPEQVLGRPTDARTDVFAVGAVLYECLTGRRAFTGPTLREVLQVTAHDPVDLEALKGAGSPRVQALIARSLEKDPSARPAEMRAVRLEIEEALGVRRTAALREGARYVTPNNLTAETTSFVGREAVLRECERLLEQSRLLTLAGMGGSGKTRVAQRLAEGALARFTEGVWLVNLAGVAESVHVADVTAAALELEEEPGRSPLEALLQRVRDHRMLFVIDNCEHVLEGVQQLVGALLAACPRVRVLATSREPLALEGETVYSLPTLALPERGATEVSALMSVEAVRLFVERAAAGDPEFSLSAHAGDVVEICRRLDGIPLALELAAARVKVLGVAQIRARIGDRFKLLARAGGAGTSRQQTVHATIQWSWDHLLPPERDLMRRLAVFTGGWTLERATEVVSDTHDEFEVLDLLTRLVERSLVVVERPPSSATRYRFLESVHQFALEQLQSHGEHAALRERHLEAYLALAGTASLAMIGSGAAQQVAELVPEEENFLAALAWCDQAEDGSRRGLLLAEKIYRFWTLRGRFTLAGRMIEEALKRDAGNPPSRERARALVRAAGVALMIGDPETARRHLEESLAFWEPIGEPSGLAQVLSGLGVVAMYQGRYEDAHRLAEQGLELYQRLGQTRGVAMAIHNLATIEFALGVAHHGRPRFEEALAMFREVGDTNTETLCLGALATARLRCGDAPGARQALRECLDRLEQFEQPRESVYALEALAELLAAEGRPLDAARLLGWAEGARAALKVATPPMEEVELDRLMARLRQAADASQLEAAVVLGRGLTLSAALAEARKLL
jgi:predicted ATPase